MRTVISAAETGHLIIGTMHASTVYQALDRILTQAGADSRLISQMLANNLLCMLAQNLIPARDSTEENPRRVLCYEALFHNKGLAQHLFQNKSVSPEQIKGLAEQNGGISWNTCLEQLVQRSQIHQEDVAALRNLESN
jgi:twitching motility protein PilU